MSTELMRNLFILIIFLLLVLCASAIAAKYSRALVLGGYGLRRPARPTQHRHLVVDGLNLMHWLHTLDHGSGRPVALDPAAVAAAIARTAPVFRKALRDPYGLLIYVVKDRDGKLNDGAVRAAYQAAAEKYRVEITSVEQDNDAVERKRARAAHAARGRDDFYTCLLAQRYRCAVASEDRLHDFDEFRAQVPPFRTVTFTHNRALPANDFIRPTDSAYARLKRPRMVRFETVLSSLKPFASPA